jgi:hypothetical protein
VDGGTNHMRSTHYFLVALACLRAVERAQVVVPEPHVLLAGESRSVLSATMRTSAEASFVVLFGNTSLVSITTTAIMKCIVCAV